jgi:hypothetical protein
MKVNNPEDATKCAAPQRLERDEKPLIPKMKWAQTRTMAYLGIEIFNMKVHRVQIASDGTITFL